MGRLSPAAESCSQLTAAGYVDIDGRFGTHCCDARSPLPAREVQSTRRVVRGRRMRRRGRMYQSLSVAATVAEDFDFGFKTRRFGSRRWWPSYLSRPGR